MRPIEFLVLAVLSDRDLHGYAMVKEIGRRTGGRTVVKPGNLYRVLDRLFERGLVDHAEPRSAADVDNERRRYYQITDLGRRTLQTEAELLGALVDDVRASLPEATETAP